MIDAAAMSGVSAVRRRSWVNCLLAVVTGLALALPFLYPQLYLLTWVAFVPLLIATHNSRAMNGYLLGFVSGLVFYYVAAYWISDFFSLFKNYSPLQSQLAAIGFWIYCAQLPALLFASFRLLVSRFRAPAMLVFPALVAVFYAHFPMMFPVQLGESQSHFPAALQAIAFTGVHGLDAVIALTNLGLAQWVLQWRSKGALMPPRLTQAAVLVAGLWLSFGVYSNHHWERQQATWPELTVGLVQPNEFPDTGIPPVYRGFSRGYPPEMAMTEHLIANGAELVIWPEARFKGYFSQPQVPPAFQHHIAALGVPLLFQDMEPAPTPEGRRRRHYNAVKLLDAAGQPAGHYRKIKRVAFGESLPVIEYIQPLRTWLESYLGDFFHEIAPGDLPNELQVDGLTLVPLICYETLFPAFTARAAAQGGSQRVLVGLSSNAWFGYTRQPYQHLHTSRLRAVENRTPMVHVMNNGPSAVILPSGKLSFETPFDVAGGFLAQVPLRPDTGVSFFARYPYAFLGGCYILIVILLIRSFLQSAIRSVASRNHQSQGATRLD
jgi:apolipoprotein N-acyltransferase